MQKIVGLAIDNEGRALKNATVTVVNSITQLVATVFEDDESTVISEVSSDKKGFYEFKVPDGSYDIIVAKGSESRRMNGIIANDNQFGPSLLGKLIGADFNSIADQQIPIRQQGGYIVDQILVTNPSVALGVALGGIYTAAAKGGTALIPATRKYDDLVNPSDFVDLWPIVVSAHELASTSLPNNTQTPVDFDTIEEDANGAVTVGAGWVFTAPRKGRYVVHVFTIVSAVAWAAGQRALLRIFKNGSNLEVMDRNAADAAGTFPIELQGSSEIELAAGDTLQIRAEQNSGVSSSTSGSREASHVTIREVGRPADGTVLTNDPLYLSLSTPQGAAATADVYVLGRRLR